MSTRRHHLITYDVADDKRRKRIFEGLKGVGDHAQYSVFFADLNPREIAELRAKLDGWVHHDEDQVLIVDLGPAHHPLDAGLEAIGKAWDPPVRCLVV